MCLPRIEMNDKMIHSAARPMLPAMTPELDWK